MKLRLSRNAQVHRDDIWLHIAELSQNTEGATRTIQNIDRTIKLIGKNPSIGRRRDHDLGRDIRTFPIDQHLVVYRVSRSVTILGVYHHTRNLPSLFQ